MQHEVFQLVRKSNVWTSVLDAVWVRKRKRMPDGSVVVKSRLCIRGFLDPQKWFLPTRATTASRLSQRLLMSVASLMGWQVESIDVGNAFLQGFSFDMMASALRSRGLTPVENRSVILEPPANVWRHFRELPGCKWLVSDKDIGQYVLKLIKAMYGLNDAPLAWQMCVSDFLAGLGARPSIFDENLHMWFDSKGTLEMMATVHVDDNGIAGPRSSLDKLARAFEDRFGKIQRQLMPFTHCGVHYSVDQAGTYSMDQREFCEKLTTLDIDRSRKDEEPLSAKEATLFRSQLGALLWLCVTRPDVVMDVCFLQQEISHPTIGHLRATNKVVKKAKRHAGDFGIRFPKLRPPLRLCEFTDASHATRQSSYAMEGMVTLLMEETGLFFDKASADLTDVQARQLAGRAHLLAWCGRKAKRISYSTSHAETLAICSGKDIAVMINLRLTELLAQPLMTSVQQSITTLEHGRLVLPLDQMTDCNDAYELITGGRPLPDDKTQRLYIESMRQERLAGTIRHFYKVPTQSMLADCLTKVMASRQMELLLTRGILDMHNETAQCIKVRRQQVRDRHQSEDRMAVGVDV